MYQRKEKTQRIINDDGSAVNFRFLTGRTIEDVLLQATKAYAYKVITGIDKTSRVKRQEKDYLIKLYTLS
jgi:hypothetical protein